MRLGLADFMTIAEQVLEITLLQAICLFQIGAVQSLCLEPDLSRVYAGSLTGPSITHLASRGTMLPPSACNRDR